MKKLITITLLLLAAKNSCADVSVMLGVGSCEADTKTVCDHGATIHARIRYEKPIQLVDGLKFVAEFNHFSHKDDDEPNRWFEGNFRGGSGLIETRTIGLEYKF